MVVEKDVYWGIVGNKAMTKFEFREEFIWGMGNTGTILLDIIWTGSLSKKLNLSAAQIFKSVTPFNQIILKESFLII